MLSFRKWRKDTTKKTNTCSVMKYACEFGPKRKGFNCRALLRVKKYFNGRVDVERGGKDCNHKPTGEERKYRLYNKDTNELIQEAIKTNVHIRNKFKETLP